MSELAVDVEGLRFTWPGGAGEGGFALDVPRWSLPLGARAALHGPSGCGKSTLLNLVAGILPARGGRLMTLGVDLVKATEAERRAHRISRLGMVFQDFPLVDYLDATENVLLPYRIHGALTLNAAARERAAALLTRLGLARRLRHRPDALSQGERQRVAIARALVTEPSMLLADEPTAGLDPRRAQEVMDLIEGLSAEAGLTLIMVTHDAALLPRFDEVLEVARLSGEAGGAP